AAPPEVVCSRRIPHGRSCSRPLLPAGLSRRRRHRCRRARAGPALSRGPPCRPRAREQHRCGSARQHRACPLCDVRRARAQRSPRRRARAAFTSGGRVGRRGADSARRSGLCSACRPEGHPMTISVYYHPGYAAPIGKHVMPIDKFEKVAGELRGESGISMEEPSPLTSSQLERVHTRQYIDAVRTGEPRELAESQKFPWTPELYPSVLLTGGGCLAAARRALEDGIAGALASG